MVISNSAPETHVQDNVYETDALIAQYCEFHYGNEYFSVPNFPVHCVQQLMEHVHRLGTTFDFVDVRDIPFVIRETARKFQHTVTQMTLWRKRKEP